MSHKKNKHRIKVLPWSDFFPPQRLPSHTRWTLTAHILHTHARVLIPLFWQQNGEQRPPRALKSHTLSIFHTNGAYSHWNSLPFGIHNMHRTLLKPVLFDGEMGRCFRTCSVFTSTERLQHQQQADVWWAVQCFGSQMIQIRCRCEWAQLNDIMGSQNWSLLCLKAQS